MTHRKSAVFFSDLHAGSAQALPDKIRLLLNSAGLSSIAAKNDLTAVKLHFGEKGNTAFLRPVFIRVITDALSALGSRPFLTDTNTLYCGERTEAVTHVTTALVHGFNFTTVAAPVIIADGLRGSDEVRIPVQGKHFSHVLIGSAIAQADALVCISHFKGHELCGFGGALKNLGMGCASREGKMKQHTDISPTVQASRCTGCGRCIDSCPAGSIAIKKKKAIIDSAACIGCAKCISLCPREAISISWDENSHFFQEKMIEYALGIFQQKRGKIIFVNFLTNISPQCDCYGYSDMSIVADIGILASQDPVAIDQASADLVNAQSGSSESALKKNCKPFQDKFRGLYPAVDWTVQLGYAQKLGIGSRGYTLKKI